MPDRRVLPVHAGSPSELRFDRRTGEWVVIAAQRQERTYKPPPDQCPLCPGPTGLSSEIPALDYDVVVFENRFASLSAADNGRCEVVCFSSDHNGSFGGLDHRKARLVVDVWRDRTGDLMSRPGIEQVFCFENRGEQIGVTLTHPHGQIYGYPYLPPTTRALMAAAGTHRQTHGTNMFADMLAEERADGARIIMSSKSFTALAPFAARWPVEVHIYPNRKVRSLLDFDDAELEDFTFVYQQILQRLDRMYADPMPYMSALHQYTDSHAQREGYFHAQVISIRRSATKLKYLASSESVMGAFINDVSPEALADTLRGL